MTNDASAVAAQADTDERTLVASGLMLPRLAAFGPTLNLAAVGAGWRHGEVEKFRLTGRRVANMVLAIIIGLVVLVAPMSVLAYAADQIAQVTNATQRQHVPSGDPLLPEKREGLTPAYSANLP